jgi:hypothetical protein
VTVEVIPEDQLSEVLVFGDDDEALGLDFAQQIGVRCLHARFRRIEHVVALTAEPLDDWMGTFSSARKCMRSDLSRDH